MVCFVIKIRNRSCQDFNSCCFILSTWWFTQLHRSSYGFTWAIRGRSQAWRRVESLFRQEDQVTLGHCQGRICQRENMPHTIFPNSFSGKTSTTCCKISLRYQVMFSIIWLDYCSLLLRWHCWAKCMRHEVLKSSWVWYKRNLDSSVFFSACNEMLEFHTYLEGKSSHFDSCFFCQNHHLEFRNDHIQLCSFYCILKLFRDI